MDKETIEEAAEKEFPLMDTEWCRTGACEEENFQLLGHRRSFIEGAQWQAKRMYSEEEVKDIVEQTIEKFYKHTYADKTKAEMKGLWFEQLKKK